VRRKTHFSKKKRSRVVREQRRLAWGGKKKKKKREKEIFFPPGGFFISPPPTKAVHACNDDFSYLYVAFSAVAQCVRRQRANLRDRQQVRKQAARPPCALWRTKPQPPHRQRCKKKSEARLAGLVPITLECCLRSRHACKAPCRSTNESLKA